MRIGAYTAHAVVLSVLLALAACGKQDTNQTPQPPAQPEASVQKTKPVEIAAERYGVLSINVPEQCDVQDKDPGFKAGAAKAVESHSKDGFSMLVAILGPKTLMPGFGGDEWLRRELETWREGIAGDAVEKNLEPVRFESGDVTGYYMVATDASPGPGEYRYILKGFFDVDGCVVSMGVLHARTGDAEVKEFLDTISSAQWHPGQAGAAST